MLSALQVKRGSRKRYLVLARRGLRKADLQGDDERGLRSLGRDPEAITEKGLFKDGARRCIKQEKVKESELFKASSQPHASLLSPQPQQPSE